MRVAIVGPGAMGLLFGLRLARCHSVRLLHHSEVGVRALRGGATLLDEEGAPTQQVLPVTTDPQVALDRAELVLVTVKAWATPDVARQLAQHLPAAAFVLSLQNGLGNLETLAEWLQPERLLGGTTTEGATREQANRVRHAGRGLTEIGWLQPQGVSGADGMLCQVRDAFQQVGFQTLLTKDLQQRLWRKVLVNAAINPVTALLDVPNGWLLEDDAEPPLWKQVASEVVAVAAAAGHRLEEPHRWVEAVATQTARNSSSMRQDIQAGRRTEIDAINGAVVRVGDALDVATPLNGALTALVHGLERRNRRRH